METHQFGLDLWFEIGVTLIVGVALLALPLAILVTLGLIRWYRARVARSMRATAGVAPPVRLPQRATPPGRLTIERVVASGALAGQTRRAPLVSRARRSALRLATTYGAAAALFSLLMAAAFVISLNVEPQGRLLLTYTLLLGFFGLVFGTPAALVPVVMLTRQPRFLLLAVVALLALLQAADRSFGLDMTGLWLLVAAVPTAAVLLLNTRRTRAIGSVVFAALLLLLYGILAGMAYGAIYAIDVIGPVRFVRADLADLPFLEAEERYLSELLSLPAETIVDELSSLVAEPLSVLHAENPERLTTGVLLGVGAIGLGLGALGVAAAWAFVRWLAERYRLRRASDQMLTVDVLMLIFGVPLLLMNLLPFDGIKATGVLAGLLGYLLGARWGLRRQRQKAAPSAPCTLLLLRVFAADRRTERLLEDFGKRWRHLGPIRLIGAPDAAYNTIEPHEFFDFMSGRLSRAFVKDAQDLAGRLAESANAPDPDGLYRVEDFFCHDDTWRMTVTRLAREASAVLMDLRGFSSANRGCIFEIEELVAAVPLERIVLLVDRSTDLPFLEQVLADAWHAVPADSPNAAPGEHRLRILQASRRQGPTLASLLGLLCESATPRAASGSSALSTGRTSLSAG